MTQTELISNLAILIKHFQDKKDNAESTLDYTENHMAVLTLETALQQIELLANLGYVIKYIARME